ncbi:MAG: hypothetical protein KDA81_21995 [Planctomycetaceae bacterium]|nr:hypothetical protein [Planctomycetaceae bacterium]
MNNETNHRKRGLSEDDMDQILHSFFRMEVPAELNQLPSTWPQIQKAHGSHGATLVTDAAISSETSAEGFRQHRSRRVLAVLASLTACAMLLLMTTSSPPVVDQNHAVTTENPVPGTQGLMNVSSGDTSTEGVVDDRNTTLEEIDGIELTPEKKPTPKNSGD